MQNQPGRLIVRIVSAMAKEQTGTVHFISTMFKPGGGGFHKSPYKVWLAL